MRNKKKAVAIISELLGQGEREEEKRLTTTGSDPHWLCSFPHCPELFHFAEAISR